MSVSLPRIDLTMSSKPNENITDVDPEKKMYEEDDDNTTADENNTTVDSSSEGSKTTKTLLKYV